MVDIAHLLRPAHLAQLSLILKDPEASDNDRFVALELLKNANIAAGMILPSCQDTGTGICMGKRGGHVLTDGDDEAHISRGIFDAYTQTNLRYSQVAPQDMFIEANTKTNLPAQIDIYATKGNTYNFLYMAKGGGSANKTFLYQQTKALLNEKSLMSFVEEKIKTLGTSACPPYHIALAIGEQIPTLPSWTTHSMSYVRLSAAYSLLPNHGSCMKRAGSLQDLVHDAQALDP